MAYKRSSKKTGSTTRTTTTTSSKGTRNTFSTKSSLGGKNKRTHSRSWTKDGRLRQTTTDNHNGWVTRKSKVFGSKPKRSGGRRGRKSKGDGLLFRLIVWMMFLPFKIVWWILKKIFGR